MADTASTGTHRRSGSRLGLPTAGWRAACSACARAKIKCLRSNPAPNSKCDTCQRLDKECTSQVVRPRKKRRAKPLKTDGDPGKLVDLGDHHPSSSSSQPEDLNLNNPWAVPDTYNTNAPPSCTCRAPSDDAPPPPDSDEALLNIYRNELLPAHPFVVIPPTMSAAALKETRPFLMSAIRMVASFRSLRSMRAQMYHLMKHISEHMLIRSERTIDLLQGIIVISGWYQYHCFMHAQLSNLISLAQALVGDLGLGMPPVRRETTVLAVLKPFDTQPRTNEERRALAGVWFLSSSLSLGFGKIESIKYTRYLHQCLGQLEESDEYETDTTLVQIVRVQHLLDRIAQCNAPQDSMEDMGVMPSTPTPRAACVSGFQAELDQIRQNLPSSLRLDKIFQTYLNTAALRLHAPPSIDSELIESLSESLASPSDESNSPLDEIYRSRAALVAWFDNWLSVPVSSYHSQTTATCSLVIYAISMLNRWAKLIIPSKLRTERVVGSPGAQKPPADPRQYRSSPPSAVSSAPTPADSDSNQDTEYCASSQHNRQVKSDPQLPVAVASLQARLQQQRPGLDVDIPGILSTLQGRFQQVSLSIQEWSASEAESGDLNVWSMSAVKILSTRARLARWAELVVEGIEALSLEDGAVQKYSSGEDVAWNALPDGFLGGFGAGNSGMGMGMPDFGDGMGTGWMAGLMPGTEPMACFDGYMNWSPMMMDSMGSVDQYGRLYRAPE